MCGKEHHAKYAHIGSLELTYAANKQTDDEVANERFSCKYNFDHSQQQTEQTDDGIAIWLFRANRM